MRNLQLNLGSSCNLNCHYCYEKNRNNGNEMSEEVLEKVIELINGNNKISSINFFGGEPTLYKEKMDFILSNINPDKKRKMTFGITTNGLKPDVIFELEKKFNIFIQPMLSNKSENDDYSMYSDYHYKFIITPYNIKKFTPSFFRKMIGNKKVKDFKFGFDMTADWKNVAVDEMEKLVKMFYNGNVKQSNYELQIPRLENIETVNCTTNSMKIDYNGNAVMCHRFFNSGKGQLTFGNILTDDFEKLYRKRMEKIDEVNYEGKCYFFRNTDNGQLTTLSNTLSLVNDNLKNTSTLCTCYGCGCSDD